MTASARAANPAYSWETILRSDDPSIYDIRTRAPGPAGSLPLTEQMLLNWSSGDLFGLSQDAGTGCQESLRHSACLGFIDYIDGPDPLR